MMPSAPPISQGQHQCSGAELDGDGKAGCKEFRHGEVRQIVARTEVALQEVLKIEQILLPQGLVEVEGPLEIGLDDWVQALFLVERPSRRDTHQEERDRHDHE